VWIEVASDIAEEYYASFTLDRSAKKHLGMLSAQGGVEIEAVAETDPDAIAKIWIDPVDGLDRGRGPPWVAAAKLNPAATEGAVDILGKLYTGLRRGRRRPGRDQPAHPQAHRRGPRPRRQGHAGRQRRVPSPRSWEAYEATQERDEREQAAHDKGLQYVGLDGSVGVIANGAGLAMSTLDVVNQAGGKPANFLDIGGGANAEVMAGAEVINNDPNVKSIFINIFGGITRGEEVANGIVTALASSIDAPIVIRLDGTNADRGPRDPQAAHLESTHCRSKPTMLEAAARPSSSPQPRDHQD
jgi:succinyl-CoA synthetase beta subunit